MSHDNSRLRYFVRAGIIASLYATLTLVIYPYSFAAIQFRVSEAMCVLPLFLPEAIPGLFVGCIVSNLLTPNIAILDVVFGSAATLLAAFLTSKVKGSPLKTRLLAPLPPVLFNAVIVGAVITLSATDTGGQWLKLYIINALCVGAGEAAVCYGLGIPLMVCFEKIQKVIKGRSDLHEQ